jgi:ribosomal protein S18 acetylase RimI-like enzyme
MVTDNPATPIRLSQPDIPRAAETLSRAFAEDPFVCQLFLHAEQRPRHFAQMATRVLNYAIAYGEVQAVSPNLEGVAVWFSPSRIDPSLWAQVRFGLLALPFLMGFRSTRLMLSYTAHLARLRREHVRGPHWLLQLLGVEPSHHGEGHGTFLLRHMLASLDSQRIPCCLDTENEKNLAFYEHLGFRVLASSRIPGSDCDCWLMARGVEDTPLA